MFDFLERMREDLQRWVWKYCPFCSSEAEPGIGSGSGFGGYQESVVLQCPDCGNSIKFVTEWSPVINFPLVNEIPEMIQDEYCPFLSIQKKEDHILLRCCSNIPRDCFGRSPEICYAYHKTKTDEAIESSDYGTAIREAEMTMELWKKEHPEEVPPLGTYQLVETKRRTLSRANWVKWIDERLRELESSEDYGSAASIALMVAETLQKPRFWKRASHLYNKYIRKLSADLEADEWVKKRRKKRKIVRSEAVRLEALSEIEENRRYELLRLAGEKWAELYKLSADPFSHPNFLYFTFYLRNQALADPTEAPSLYKKAYEFLMAQLDTVKYHRERVYYEGHAKYFLGLHSLTRANYTDEEDEKISLLEKSIEALDESIDLHKMIGLREAYANTMINCIRSILCAEKFKKDEKFDLIDEATQYLDIAKTYHLPHRIIEIVDALIGSYKEALAAIENPKQALLLMAKAEGKLNEFIKLLPTLSIRDIPIPKILEAQKDYLGLYLDTIRKNVKSFAGRKVSFNNIVEALDQFRTLIERQGFSAVLNEDVGRSFVQVYLDGSFPQRKLQFKEVEVAKGRSDNLLIVDVEKYPFEVKIWKGQKYYEKGLKQIKYYIDHENVSYGFYIIFDPRVRDYRSGGSVIEYDSKKIYQISIHISPSKP